MKEVMFQLVAIQNSNISWHFTPCVEALLFLFQYRIVWTFDLQKQFF